MIRAGLLAPLVLGLTGCCAVAEWMCGPDTSQWVSVSFATPTQALATFREAARRGDSHVAYLSFSRGFLDRAGLGAFEFAVFWDKLNDEFPVHLLGNATVRGPSQRSETSVDYALSRLGHTLELRLVRQDLLELTYYDDEFELVDGGDYPRSLRRNLRVETVPSGDTRVVVDFETLLDLERLDPGRVQRAGVARQWKIDALRVLDDEGNPQWTGP